MYCSKSLPFSTPAARPPAAISVPSAIVVILPCIAVSTWPCIVSTSLPAYPKPFSLASAASIPIRRLKPNAPTKPPTAPIATPAGLVMELLNLLPKSPVV